VVAVILLQPLYNSLESIYDDGDNKLEKTDALDDEFNINVIYFMYKRSEDYFGLGCSPSTGFYLLFEWTYLDNTHF